MPSLFDRMNVNLADWNVMYVKLHHYHWYVKGPHFLALHEKFEELYTFAASSLDELAERLLAIGGRPASAMKTYLSLATIGEAVGESQDADMVKAVANDFTHLAGELTQSREMAEQAGDFVTADLFVKQIEELQKQIWMLSATAGIELSGKG